MRLVVLISGQGSNLQAIIDAQKNHTLACEIVAVISNKADAFGLIRAKNAGIPAIVQSARPPQTREQYDAELAACVQSFQPDLIVLAGWMRVLSETFLTHFPRKVINLHPALPGQFPGLHAIEKAWAAFQQQHITHTGVMVHWVLDKGVDCGPVLAQEKVAIFADDTLQTLTDRMHQVEHQLLVEVLQKLIKKENHYAE